MPKMEGVPRYKDFNTIRKNYPVKDEEVLRYVPYFGENEDVDLSETYKVEVRTPEEEEDLERKFRSLGNWDRIKDIFAYCGEIFGDE
jgi:hypothetical protein